MEQKSACDSMIDEKNKLIHDFQQVCELVFNLLVIHSYNKVGYSLEAILYWDLHVICKEMSLIKSGALKNYLHSSTSSLL